MLDDILKHYKASTYDFRLHACQDDPLLNLFDEWVDYYRMKLAIARTIKPSTILEIGVRYGYSARAFLEGSPHARFVGIDADTPTFGGQSGAVDWAEQSLASQFDVSIVKVNSQDLNRFPGEVFDLIHVDGQQDGDGTFHDLDLALLQARYILVDGYHWTRDNFLAANEWLWLNKAAVEAVIIIPGYAGELLIRTKVAETCAVEADSSLPLAPAYTTDYYLNDCGGYTQWRQSKGKVADTRLQAVADVGMALSSPGKVVDLGAGRGELTRIFAQQGVHVTSIDYSTDAVKLIEKTLEGDTRANVDIICGSVLNPEVYDERYDLAIASDIVEHLSPEEDDILYEIVSRKLKPNNGTLVIHTAPNLWHYLYEHPRQQKAAKQAGFWLPRTRRTWFERIMHVNEQNPRVLKRQLARYFPHVLIWFTDSQGMGGSLLRRFSIADLRRASSLFAVASHRPIDAHKIASVFSLPPLSEDEAKGISLQVTDTPQQVKPEQEFFVSVLLSQPGQTLLTSCGDTPMHLSYHWTDEFGRTVIFEGLRTDLQVPARPGRETRYEVCVQAPKDPGRYHLRVLPVQEEVRWHDMANHIFKSIEVKDLING
jgi:2-polyprenyl-3-methyl-5-hydroxy-6-metoxy-1,4-benzoquinol methylase